MGQTTVEGDCGGRMSLSAGRGMDRLEQSFHDLVVVLACKALVLFL